MSSSYLRSLVQSRFLQLLLSRPANDQRSNDTLRKQAAREIIREQRGEGSSASVSSTPNNGFELVFRKLWAICCRMNHYADQRTVPARAENVTPTIIDAPLVVNDLSPARARDNAVTLPVFNSGGGKQLIDSAEYPNRFGAARALEIEFWPAHCQ